MSVKSLCLFPPRYTVTNLEGSDVESWLLFTLFRILYSAWLLLPGHSLHTLFTSLEVVAGTSSLEESSLDWHSFDLVVDVFFPEQTGDLAKWSEPSHL